MKITSTYIFLSQFPSLLLDSLKSSLNGGSMSTGRVVFYGAPSNYKGGEIAGPPSKFIGAPIKFVGGPIKLSVDL